VTHHTRATAAALAAACALLVAAALPAAAHVTVSSPDASPGGFGKLVVRVPSESDSASTTKVAVTLPADSPFAFVSTKPHPGWTVATTERTLDTPVQSEGFTLTKAVATVTWTATGPGIGPGEFDEFEISAGPFPSGVETVTLPATQTYSDGTVVAWDQPVSEGADEPEHPAPTLTLAGSAADPPAAGDTSDGADPSAAGDASDPGARWLAGGALAAALAALAVALVGARRRAT
jgi:uncharacterized protein